MQQIIRITILLLLVAMCSHAQTPALDSIRKEWKLEGTVYGELALVRAFTQHGLTDSVFAHTSKLKQQELSPNNLVRLHLFESRAHLAFSDSDARKTDLMIANSIIQSSSVDVCLASEVFDELHYTLLYWTECQEGFEIAKQYASMGQRSGEAELELTGLWYQKMMLDCLKDSTSSQRFEKRFLQLLEGHPGLEGIHLVLQADHFYYHGDIPMAIAKYTEAMLFYERMGWERDVASVNQYLGDSYSDLYDFEKGIEFYNRCESHIKANQPYYLSNFYNSLGWSYYRTKKFKQALKYTKLAVKAYNKHNKGNPDLAFPIGNLGIIYRELGMPDSAMHYSMKAINLFDTINFLGGMAEARNNIGFVYLNEGAFEKAMAQFEMGLRDAIQDGGGFDEMNSHNGLQQLHKQLGNSAKALFHLERYQKLKSKFDSDRDAILAQNLQAEKLLNENEQRIRNLELESEIQASTLREKTLRLNVFILVSLTLFILTIMVFWYWLQRKTLLRKLEASNTNNERIIRMISHDFRGPIQNITSILELLESKEITREEFDALASTLYMQSSNVSLLFDSFVGWAVSQNEGYEPSLKPFDWSDMIESVTDLVGPMARMKGVDLRIAAPGTCTIHGDEMAVSLILRNLISNSIKFTEKGAAIELLCNKVDGFIVTTVRDEGMGMENEKLQEMLNNQSQDQTNMSSGLGIRMSNMYVRSLEGRIEGESEPGKGTTIRVWIPATEVHPST